MNRKVTVKKQKVDWLSIRWIQVTKDKPFAFKYRCSLNDLEQMDVKRKQQGRPVDMNRVRLQPLFTGPHAIKRAKMDNLHNWLMYPQHTTASIGVSRVLQAVRVLRTQMTPSVMKSPQMKTLAQMILII